MSCRRPQLYDIASSVFAQKLSQVKGVGPGQVGGSSLPAVRVEVNPQPLSNYNVGLDQIGTFLQGANANQPQGRARERQDAASDLCHRPAFPGEGLQGSGGGLPERRAGPPVGPGPRGRWQRRCPQPRHRQRQSDGADPDQPPAECQYRRHGRAHQSLDAAVSRPSFRPTVRFKIASDRTHHHPRFRSRCPAQHDHFHRAGDPGGVHLPAQRLVDVHSQHLGAGFASSPLSARCI